MNDSRLDKAGLTSVWNKMKAYVNSFMGTVDTSIDRKIAANNNAIIRSGSMVMDGTPDGCTATVAKGYWGRIGDVVTFNVEINIANNGTGTTPIAIPCLPFNIKKHSTFTVGYKTFSTYINGSSSTPAISHIAGGYDNSNCIYLGYGYGGRTYAMQQKEVGSSGVILIAGTYIVADGE